MYFIPNDHGKFYGAQWLDLVKGLGNSPDEILAYGLGGKVSIDQEGRVFLVKSSYGGFTNVDFGHVGNITNSFPAKK